MLLHFLCWNNKSRLQKASYHLGNFFMGNFFTGICIVLYVE